MSCSSGSRSRARRFEDRVGAVVRLNGRLSGRLIGIVFPRQARKPFRSEIEKGREREREREEEGESGSEQWPRDADSGTIGQKREAEETI